MIRIDMACFDCDNEELVLSVILLLAGIAITLTCIVKITSGVVDGDNRKHMYQDDINRSYYERNR